MLSTSSTAYVTAMLTHDVFNGVVPNDQVGFSRGKLMQKELISLLRVFSFEVET